MRGYTTTILALLASAILVALGLTSFHEETARSRPVIPPFDLFWCAKNEDCALVDQIGCCSCSQAGAQAAVTKWDRDDLRRFLKSACRPRPVCVQLDLCRDDLEARCVHRRCVALPKDAESDAD